MDKQLRQQLRQTVLIASTTGINVDGERSYGAATSHRARFIGRHEFVRTDVGEKMVSNRQIILESSVDVRIDSRYYAPGETTSDSEGWLPISIALRIGENGSSAYWKVWLGERS